MGLRLQLVLLCGFIIGVFCGAELRPTPAHAQCAGSVASFVASTHVEIHPSPVLPGYVVACYDLNGILLTPSSVQVPNGSVIFVNFGSSSSGNCFAK